MLLTIPLYRLLADRFERSFPRDCCPIRIKQSLCTIVGVSVLTIPYDRWPIGIQRYFIYVNSSMAIQRYTFSDSLGSRTPQRCCFYDLWPIGMQPSLFYDRCPIGLNDSVLTIAGGSVFAMIYLRSSADGNAPQSFRYGGWTITIPLSFFLRSLANGNPTIRFI